MGRPDRLSSPGPVTCSSSGVRLVGERMEPRFVAHRHRQAGRRSGRDRRPLYLAGALEGSVDFGSEVLTAVDPPDVYVAALRTDDGTPVWSRRFGLSGNQAYRGMGLHAGPGGLVIAGDFGDGSVDFGTGVLTAADPGDAFIVQLAP